MKCQGESRPCGSTRSRRCWTRVRVVVSDAGTARCSLWVLPRHYGDPSFVPCLLQTSTSCAATEWSFGSDGRRRIRQAKGSGSLCRKVGRSGRSARCRDWLKVAAIHDGYLFQTFRRGGRPSGRPLHHSEVPRLVKKYAVRIGLDPASYSGHSLRAGFVTSAAAHRARLDKIMEVTRHKNPATVMQYIPVMRTLSSSMPGWISCSHPLQGSERLKTGVGGSALHGVQG